MAFHNLLTWTFKTRRAGVKNIRPSFFLFFFLWSQLATKKYDKYENLMQSVQRERGRGHCGRHKRPSESPPSRTHTQQQQQRPHSVRQWSHALTPTIGSAPKPPAPIQRQWVYCVLKPLCVCVCVCVVHTPAEGFLSEISKVPIQSWPWRRVVVRLQVCAPALMEALWGWRWKSSSSSSSSSSREGRPDVFCWSGKHLHLPRLHQRTGEIWRAHRARVRSLRGALGSLFWALHLLPELLFILWRTTSVFQRRVTLFRYNENSPSRWAAAALFAFVRKRFSF